MKSKSGNENKIPSKKNLADKPDSSANKSSVEDDMNDDIDDLDEVEEEDVKPVKKGKATSKKSKSEAEDEDDTEEVEDEWEKGDADDDYDPDFEEFDIPKSKVKSGPAKKGKEDDFELDDDFKSLDLFNDGTGSGADDDEEEDF